LAQGANIFAWAKKFAVPREGHPMPRVVGSTHSRREAQILEILYRRGRASVAELRAELPDAPSASAVRKLLDILERRGHVRRESDGTRNLYAPALGLARARRSALRQLLDTFFGGTAEGAMVALVDLAGGRISDEALERIRQRAAKAKSEER
jgi:predicted transcriptional regulator